MRILGFSMSLLLGVAAISATPANAAAIFTDCAGEGGSCTIRETNKIGTIRYLANDSNLSQHNNGAKYFFVSGLSSIGCGNNILGDPARDKGKKCLIGYHNPFEIPFGDANYSLLCSEGETCNAGNGDFPRVIRYGASGRYVYYLAMPGESFKCDNTRSNYDPYSGHSKNCSQSQPLDMHDGVSDVGANTAETETFYAYGQLNYACEEGRTCLTNTKLPFVVQYGADNRYFNHVMQGESFTCDGKLFDGDPAPGHKKYCSFRKFMPNTVTGNVFAEWRLLSGRQASTGISHSFEQSVSYGMDTAITEGNYREFTTTIGTEIEHEGKLPLVGGSTVTVSFEQSFTTGSSFEKSVTQSSELSQTLSCTSDAGVGLYVWQFTITGSTTNCLTGGSCNFISNLGDITCTSTATAPTCVMGQNCSSVGSGD